MSTEIPWVPCPVMGEGDHYLKLDAMTDAQRNLPEDRPGLKPAFKVKTKNKSETEENFEDAFLEDDKVKKIKIKYIFFFQIYCICCFHCFPRINQY